MLGSIIPADLTWLSLELLTLMLLVANFANKNDKKHTEK